MNDKYDDKWIIAITVITDKNIRLTSCSDLLKECGLVHCAVSLPSVETWIEGTYHIPLQKSDGVLAEMKITTYSYNFVIWIHIRISSLLFKDIGVESPIAFFIETFGTRTAIIGRYR